jgi:predicted dehydrogenase
MQNATAKLTASVIGGGFGGGLSLQALAASNDFDLIAVTDLRPEICQALEVKFPGLRSFTDHREMFAACPTDVVCVSTYPPSHEAITLAALELPRETPLRGLLVEKPLGHAVASGTRILEAIRARNLPVVVPHNLLAKDASLQILERVRAGEIGALRLLEVQCAPWDVINAGIHWAHFFVMLTQSDPLEWVMAMCDSRSRTFRDGMQVETMAVTYAQTQAGVRLVMNTGDHVNVDPAAGDFETLFRIVGTHGLIEYPAWSDRYRLLNAKHPHGEDIHVPDGPVTGHRRHLEQLAAQIHSAQPDWTMIESSLLALELCEGAYLSHQHRAQVRFPIDEVVPPLSNDWQPGQPYSGAGGGRDGRKL